MEPLQVVAAVIVIDTAFVLVARKRMPPETEGVWEFPGGKVEPEESLEAALTREVAEELGVLVAIEKHLDSITVQNTNGLERPLEIHFFECRIAEGVPTPLEHEAISIVPWEELKRLNFHRADKALVESQLLTRIQKSE